MYVRATFYLKLKTASQFTLFLLTPWLCHVKQSFFCLFLIERLTFFTNIALTYKYLTEDLRNFSHPRIGPFLGINGYNVRHL